MSAITSIVVASFAASLALVALAWLYTRERPSVLGHAVGPVDWDFSKSWASNLTVVGGILGTTISVKMFPATPVVTSQNGYISLSLLFALLVVVAPFVYAALQIGTDDAKGTPHFRGRGWSLLVACCVTVWGVIGQLGTLGLVFYELQHAHVFALGAVIPVWAVIGAALVLIARYTAMIIRLIIKASVPPGTEEFAGGAPASQGWSLL